MNYNEDLKNTFNLARQPASKTWFLTQLVNYLIIKDVFSDNISYNRFIELARDPFNSTIKAEVFRNPEVWDDIAPMVDYMYNKMVE